MADDAPTEELKELNVNETPADDNDASKNDAPSDAPKNDNEDDSDDEAGDDDNNEAAGDAGDAGDAGAAKKKNKRKPKKKKKKKKSAKVQSDPPRVPIALLYPNKSFPKGEEVDYAEENLFRTTDEEKRHLDNLKLDWLADYREAAEVHRQVRQWAQRTMAPGMTLTDIANGIEDGVRALTGHQGLEPGDAKIAGMGFPTGLNINHCAAHYSPNAGNKMVLQQGDVMKVDIGVHVNGSIVDSAFTVAFEPQFDPLLNAVKAATNAGVREAGIDVRLGELGGIIQEVMESYECEFGGKTYPVKAIRNLTGHTILPYSIHGDKAVPIVKTNDQTKMEEGDVFAIETFGSTGNGYVVNDMETSHYARNPDPPGGKHPTPHLSSARTLLGLIDNHFGTLPFCRRYIDRLGHDRYLLGLNQLVSSGIVESYPPLVDKKGSYTAQFEHTILLRPTVKEVISRGEDY